MISLACCAGVVDESTDEQFLPLPKQIRVVISNLLNTH